MTPFVEKLLTTTLGEWEFFGHSTRTIANVWNVAGEEFQDPFRLRVRDYWAAVGQPTWDGATKQPWSGAFISWCFKTAGAGDKFKGNAKHAVYIDRIRRNQSSTSGLKLLDPMTTRVEPGDLVWNPRRTSDTSSVPKTFDEAVARLAVEDFFISHVDIVVETRAGQCDSIGGNVSNKDPGGSVTRSTWLLSADGRIVDPRKTWIGVVKNGL
jgi:hypothetical protein